MVDVAAASFADLLKQYRARAGLTQEMLAERASLSARGISDLERGVKQRPYPHTVQRLIQALELTEDEAARFQGAARGPGAGATALERTFTRPKGWRSLPIQPTPFIGRQQEIEAIGSLLTGETVRLLTLTGAGGIGKTRLALRVAEEVADHFPDGVIFAPLASLTDPNLVPASTAAALEIVERSGEPIEERLVAYLQKKHLLLVLDNLEHLLPAADVVSRLLASCSHLSILVTSRAVLHLAAEHEYPVPPLPVPIPGHVPELAGLSQYDSVQLFLQRAQAVRPDFELTQENAAAVAEICARLDGLPLAIELAAARIRLFPPQALLDRLADRLHLLTGGPRDAPPRHQTLRSTIDWSYCLLPPEEQRLFARLSVFPRGCTFEAAEAVCIPGGELDLLAGLTSLLEQSLLRQQGEEEPRFLMLETVREYAGERLAAQGERDELRRRHAEYYTTLAEEAGPQLTEADQLYWLDVLEREHQNLRAALAWSLEERSELRLRLVGTLWRFWCIRGHLTEGRRWLDAALALTGEGEEVSFLRSRALNGAGILARGQGDYDRARALFEESLRIRQQLGYKQGMMYTLGNLGLLAAEEGDYQRAGELHKESLRLGWELGNTRSVAQSLSCLGILAERQRDNERARELHEEALRLSRELRNTRLIVTSLNNLGILVGRQREYERARELHEKALMLSWVLGDKLGIAVALVGLAAVAGSGEEHVRATQLLSAADAVWTSVEASPEDSHRERMESVSQHAHAALRVEVYEAAWNQGRAMTLEEAVACALEEGD